MAFSLDIIALGVPDVGTARDFYAATLHPAVADHGDYVELDHHGAGRIALLSDAALAKDSGSTVPSPGFRGYVISYILDQPSEVEAVVTAAEAAGATVRKAAKKSMFAGFSGVIETPDGSIWKIASANKKDKAPAGNPPVPSEVGLLLGVADPKASKDFYQAVGLMTDRDYGKSYIDFAVAPGSCRLGLMRHDQLAEDVGVEPNGADTAGMVLNARVERPSLVDQVMTAALDAGAEVTVGAEDAAWGGYTGQFTDPDGFRWKVGSS